MTNFRRAKQKLDIQLTENALNESIHNIQQVSSKYLTTTP